MLKNKNITEDHLDLMHVIQKDNKASQRQIAQQTGISIGKINYCLKALIDIGFVKIENFNKSSQKLNYAYILTPKGIKEKTILTKRFLQIKQLEYEKLYNYFNGNK